MENEDIVSALTAMSGHPSERDLSDLRDGLLDSAECRFDPELHTGPDPLTAVESPDERAAREDVAREVCQSCPVAAMCLSYALHTLPERGVWAGFTADQIQALAALFATPPDRPAVVTIDDAAHLFTASDDISADTLTLMHTNVLIGGIPGAGKSGFLTKHLMRQAADETREFTVIDGKGAA